MEVCGATDGNICIRPVSVFYSDSHEGHQGDQGNVKGRGMRIYWGIRFRHADLK